MEKEVYQKLFDDLKAYYRVKQDSIPPRALNSYRTPTYNIPDDKADEFYNYIVSNFEFFPKASTWQDICKKFRPEFKPMENDRKCWACLDEGYILYTKANDNQFMGICPRCRKGISIKELGISPFNFVPDAVASEIAKKNQEPIDPATVEKGKELYQMLMQKYRNQN